MPAVQGLKCKFQMHHADQYGTKSKTKSDCGEPAGMYRCAGRLTSLDMPLCDRHKIKIVKDYKWKLTKIDDYTEIKNEQSIQTK